MKNLIIALLFLFSLNAAAQQASTQDSLTYVNANTLIVVGKAKPTVQWTQRIDPAETAPMPKTVQGLAMNSAGIAVLFETNSPIISAKWSLAEDKYMANMTPIAHSGLDLYCFKNGKWQYVSVARPEKGKIDQQQVIVRRMDTTVKQFMLYLPLYNSVNSVEIGVAKESMIRIPQKTAIDRTKRIVVYGSSIVQGASASRSGMAYPAIIQRKMNADIINLGFSGNAKMEMEVAKYLATVDAACYVLDCIPNQTPEQVSERAVPFIKYLRSKKPETSIILVESVIRENGFFDQQVGENVRKQNENIRSAYEQLMKENYKKIYYIAAKDFMLADHDGTIDGVHLTDLGFNSIADVVLQMIRKVVR